MVVGGVAPDLLLPPECIDLSTNNSFVFYQTRKLFFNLRFERIWL